MDPIAETWIALVASGNAGLRALVVSTLRDARWQVSEATEGETLLARYEALNASAPGHVAVVSDMDMPGADGVSVARALRGSVVEVPLIVFNGALDERSIEAVQLADVVLGEPLDGDELICALGMLLGRASVSYA